MADAVRVDELSVGDHACLTFTDPDERIDLVAEFVAEGLGRGQRVVCFTDSLTPGALTEELVLREVAAAAALERGQLAVHDSHDALLANGVVSAGRMISAINGEVKATTAAGFSGLRVTADMCWASRPVAAAEELIAFERQAATLFDASHLTLICQYDRDSFDPVTLALASETHPKTVAALAYYDTPLLRICRQHRPPGIRISGEIDYAHLQPLQQALAEALRLDSKIHVNLAKLHFIDVTAATAIIKAAVSLPPGREMTIVCTREVAMVLDAIGASQVAQITLVRLA